MRSGRVLAVAFMSMALVVAACGSDDDEGASGTVDEGVKSAVEGGIGASTTAAGGSATTLAPATSIEEFESRWEARRAEIVKRITDNGWGLQSDGKTITGPEGFKIDLNTCTSTFNNNEGVSDTSIKLGATTAFSGVAADGGNVTKGMDAVFKYINEKFGGIRDSTGKTRTINLVARDDALDPTRTIPLIDEMLDNEKVFAVNSQGSGGTLRTYDKINQRCVPHPFVVTGHPAWGDPVKHPWTTGQLYNYSSEAVLWGSYIEQELPQGAKVAAIVQNNDFGKAYENGLRTFIAQSQHGMELTVERIEPTAPTVTNEMTTLAAGDPDVFIVMATGVPCTQAAVDAQNLGLNEAAEQLWMPSVCRPLSQVGRDRAGDSTEGWLVAGGGLIDINDTTKQDLAGVKWAREVLQDQGLDPAASSNLGSGVLFGWIYGETLRIAAALPGGLTKANFVVAMRALDLTDSPLNLPGVKLQLDGNRDAYLIEDSEIGQFSVEKQSWVPITDVISLNGKTPNCTWDQAAGRCN